MNKILFKGTLILTLTGFASRVIGFFYRIFLSRAFGAEGMGVYQLVSPVLALAFSVCCGGIQSAVSKYTAGEPTSHDYRHSFRVLLCGVSLSAALSILFAAAVIWNAPFIAAHILCEPRTEPLLRIIAVSIPFASLHSCINGYYYGIKNTKIPAISQLGEQLIRVGTVFLLYEYSLSHQMQLRLSCSVFGMLAGEVCSALFTGAVVLIRFQRRLCPDAPHILNPAAQRRPALTLRRSPALHRTMTRIIRMALPLSASRVVVNLLSSVEAVYIPLMLVRSGMSSSQALSVYGVLTGMALPFILFPSTLTNSFSVLLLPLISEAQEQVDYAKIRRAFSRTASCSLAFGSLCCVLFLLTGRFAGTFFFHNELAGHFILTLGFMCPFLYLSTTMSSILHGLGCTGTSLIINTSALAIRLAFVFFLVPSLGMEACLWGLLTSQLFSAAANSLAILHFLKKVPIRTAEKG